MSIKFKSFAFTFSVLIAFSIKAQENRFFMPIEITKAYENATRSYDGKPGINYWQNTVDYDIEVEIVPKDQLIAGYEEVVYYNNSPNSLSTIVLNLYADAYKKGNTRLLAVNEKYIDEGVILSKLIINGASYDLEDTRICKRKGTQLHVNLENELGSGQSLLLEINWKQKIHDYDGRTGVYDSTSFFIGYFYPQIAVYDDLFEWDDLPFTIENEFYNNLANFNVRISAPNDYMVWATGTLKNSKDIFPKKIYNRFTRAKESSEVIEIINDEDIEKGWKVNDNVWHYSARNVNDFSFSLSNHFAWKASSVKIDNRDVFVSTVHKKDSSFDYRKTVESTKKTLEIFSEKAPGVAYPYEAFTVLISKGIKGNWGMEFPMMTNMSSPSESTVIHEVFHTYFPMYVRTNEKKWAWMDEGWADYYTALLEYHYFGKADTSIELLTKLKPGSFLGTSYDLPLITPSEFLTKNAAYLSYGVPSMVFAILEQYLGKKIFNECIKEFIIRWERKSPSPYDLFYTFEDISGQDLSWLWKPWFFEYGQIDIAILSFEDGKLKLQNKGGKPIPLILEVKYNDGGIKTIYKNAKFLPTKGMEKLISIPDPQNIDYLFVNKELSDIDIYTNFYPSIEKLYEKINKEKYLGVYNYKSYDYQFNITEKEGKLFFTDTEDHFLLIPMGNESFKFDDYTIQFYSEEEGKYRSALINDYYKAISVN